MVEDDRFYVFLAGFNHNLDEVRGRIIGRKPLPRIRDVFSEVRREECRKNVMISNNRSETENSALVTKGFTSLGEEKRYNKRGDKLWCDHCKPPWHTRETCWKLHGKPPNWKRKNGGDNQPGGDSRAFQANNQRQLIPESTLFTKEQIEHLQKLF